MSLFLQPYTIQQQNLLIRMNALFDLNFLFDIEQHVIVRINEERNFAACQYLDLNLLLYTSVPYVEKDNTRYMVGVFVSL
jgi:hypothetical protein